MVADARILDLVTELMRKGHGEMRILKRIKRAASQNEVISVNERKYVESLMEKFLRASQKKQEPPKSIEEPILIQQAKPAPQEHVVVKKRHIPIKKILMLGIIATVVAVAYVSADTFELLDTNTVPIFKFSVNTDATNYRIGDIISVYGNAKESVKVSVLDASFNIIWFEEITPDSMDITLNVSALTYATATTVAIIPSIRIFFIGMWRFFTTTCSCGAGFACCIRMGSSIDFGGSCFF